MSLIDIVQFTKKNGVMPETDRAKLAGVYKSLADGVYQWRLHRVSGAKQEKQDFYGLSDEILSEAFEFLHSKEWKSDWNAATKAAEVRDIIIGAKKVFRPIGNMIAFLDFLRQKAVQQ